jgi:flavin-dependent dehydrogenase
MAKKYDVIVVGAGPAGFLAAKAAGENGLEVALLEKKADPAKLARACAQSLVSTNEYYFGSLLRLNSRDGRISFSSEGFSFKYNGDHVNLYNLVMYTPNGHKVEFGDYEERKKKGDAGTVGIEIDKEALFQSMLEEVKACHVSVFPGINVQKVTSTANSVIAEGSGKSFEGRYLIAADGCNSRVAEVAGFNVGREYYCNFCGISYYLSGVEAPHNDQIIKSTVILPDGHAHMYLLPRPTRGEHNFSVVSIDPRTDLEAAAEYFLKKLPFCAPWYKKAKILRTFSAACNCYSPVITPYKDRVLLAGDVGSTQELEISGAMVSGWRAGQAVSTAIHEENLGLPVTGTNQYLDWWKKAYINYYNHEDYMRGMALPYLLTSNEEIDYVYGHITEPVTACWNPYTGSKASAPAMAKALPIIQKERPDIVQRLQKRVLPVKQLLEEVTKISKPVS